MADLCELCGEKKNTCHRFNRQSAVDVVLLCDDCYEETVSYRKRRFTLGEAFDLLKEERNGD